LKNFKELNLIAPLQRALAEQDYLIPTPIQAKTLPAAIDGLDVLGCAQTGTGKTAAFALPILDWLGQEPTKPRPNHPQALVLAPTRELAIQIGDSFRKYGKHLPLKVSMVFGGVSERKQVRELKQGVHVLVATPGRLLDLMSQGHVRMKDLDIFVLDEADRMLDMGFLPDLKRIIKALPQKRQSLFFSATLPPKIKSLATQLLWKPVNVDVTPKTPSVEKIDQRVMMVQRSDKQSILNHILDEPNVERAIVFTKTKRGANRLSEKLERRGIKVSAIHGNKSQSARQKALIAFRNASIKVLVATDVAARGIDIDGVTHVVNFDMPTQPESYVHRIGRTGRAGAEGIAVSLCCPEERCDLKAIERLIGKRVPIAENPSLQARESRANHPNQNTTKSNQRSRPTKAKRTRRRRRN
jgi:ATP-dependent RNA helicase RhlE